MRGIYRSQRKITFQPKSQKSASNEPHRCTKLRKVLIIHHIFERNLVLPKTEGQMDTSDTLDQTIIEIFLQRTCREQT